MSPWISLGEMIVAVALGLFVWNAEAGQCAPDSVPVGPACIDRYEASVWHTTDAALIQKIRLGTVTQADLLAAHATPLQTSADFSAAHCAPTGNACTEVYAVSIAGVTPARRITWFQALAAARNAGKRLPTNAEWQAAALGTPDPGFDDYGIADCNVYTAGYVEPTGERTRCVSDVGAFDMVGNVAEWVAEWVPLSTQCLPRALPAKDVNCLAGASTTAGPGAVRRGGFYKDGPNAGVFAVVAIDTPAFISPYVGFRGAR